MKRIIRVFLVIYFTLNASCFALENSARIYNAVRLDSTLHIDGVIDELAWQNAMAADEFVQLEPREGSVVSQRTVVKLMYDNTNLYVSAMMYDTSPDSILHELGNRDEGGNLNADAFRLGIDPYNTRQTGYVFEVTASGVQSESYNDDLSFDAVWESAVKLMPDGWSLEMRIPYSAIRFPAKDRQQWGLQFARLIRRNREYDQWSLTPKEVSNRMMYWGTLEGMQGITPPLRLSLTPYLSVYGENSPVYTASGFDHYENSYSYSGGADLKIGLDERFTLDLTLLPDFSQVQSDNKVKNLTAFETIYEERRPFFKEGTDLFSKGGLFYSRRIGRTPALFYNIPSMLEDGERIEHNPDKARLINAAKISGRTDNGLGIGVLNAVTGNTYATIQKPDGSKRKIETEPLTNFNMVVLDQLMKHNSNVFIANSNVMRAGSARDANVTDAEVSLENKKNTLRLRGGYTMSRIYDKKINAGENTEDKNTSVGNHYFGSLDKIKGEHQYGISYEVLDKNYDKNDLGYNLRHDYSNANIYYTLYKFNPFWKHFKYGNLSFWMNRQGRLSDANKISTLEAGTNFFLLFNSNWSIYSDFGTSLVRGRDYYEPRTEGLFYRSPEFHWGSVNVTTDYNKTLAFDFGSRTNFGPAIDYKSFGYYIIPRVRISDKWSFNFSYYYDIYTKDLGYVNSRDNNGTQQVIFGRRDITTITNTLTTRYLFKNDMSLSLTARHYWSKGKYDEFYFLRDDGYITQTDWNQNEDFNSNYITADLVYNWQFAPGSFFLVTYKNQIFKDDQLVSKGYFRNFSGSIDEPQINSISLKVLYYLDYQSVRKKKA